MPSPIKIVRADTEKLRNIWESILLKGINNIRSRNSGVNYVVLRTSHLVALGLFVFVRTDKIAMVRDVEISIKKVRQ